jgi:hypothetical protein
MSWLRTLFSGRPHFYIGGQDDPYMLRWYLIPLNPWFNVYLHKFMRDDDDRALHDHPWWFVSLILKGGYQEVVDVSETGRRLSFSTPYDDDPLDVEIRSAGSVAYRPAEHRHRVVLYRGVDGKKIPCWTLVATGRKKRTWGFYCPKGFVPWFDFVDQNDHGNVGRGCE